MRMKVYRPPRLYHHGDRWPKARAEFLRGHPLCAGCLAIDKCTPADCVDHIVPFDGDQLRFWDQSNWQPACTWHHNSVKATLENQWRAGKINAAALSLASPEAIALTKRRWKPQIGLDGWPVE